MSTTALFVEQVVVGCQAAVWLFLFAMAIVQPAQMITWITRLHDWTNLLSIVAIALIYSIGVVIDRIFDAVATLLKPHERLARTRFYKAPDQASHADDLIRVYEKANILAGYIQYVVSRTRVARSTMFNVPLITIAALVNIDPRLHPWIAVLLIVGGFFATGMSVIAYISLIATLQQRGRQLLGDPKAAIAG